MNRKIISLCIIGLLSSNVHAGCYLKSDALGYATGSIEKTVDVKRYITNEINSEKKCIVTFRGFAKGTWWDGIGEFKFQTNVSDDVACDSALERGKNELVQRIFSSKITTSGQMVCSDFPQVVTAPAKIGDLIDESSVRLHPDRKGEFDYKGTACRYFIETEADGNDVYTWQGVICKVHNNKWKVVDKW